MTDTVEQATIRIAVGIAPAGSDAGMASDTGAVLEGYAAHTVEEQETVGTAVGIGMV